MTTPADRFLELLRRLNRKERFYLVGHALGNREFRLSDDFRRELSTKLGIHVPEDSFVAMDYHLNWIYAAAHLSTDASLGDSAICANPFLENSYERRVIQGNQEDIDLIVAFRDGDPIELLLIEAKGVTSWDNKQLRSKATRLKSVFGDDGAKYGHINPHFVIVSPVESSGLITKDWPSWMLGEKVAWLEMTVPSDLLAVTRCDSQGNVTRFGDHWKIKPEKTFKGLAGDSPPAETVTA
jgi:hypothetical protein